MDALVQGRGLATCQVVYVSLCVCVCVFRGTMSGVSAKWIISVQLTNDVIALNWPEKMRFHRGVTAFNATRVDFPARISALCASKHGQVSLRVLS